MDQGNSQPESGRKSPFALRMSDDLRERVELSAGMNKRSVNAEICALLEKGLEPASLDCFSDAAILFECRRRFEATISVNVVLTESQLNAFKERSSDDLEAAG